MKKPAAETGEDSDIGNDKQGRKRRKNLDDFWILNTFSRVLGQSGNYIDQGHRTDQELD